MSGKGNEKLTRVLNLRIQEEKSAQSRMRSANAALQRAQQQASELATMLSEYRVQHSSGEGKTAAKLSQFTRFYDRLYQAQTAQGQTIAELQQQVMVARNAYLQAYRQRSGLENLLKKREQAHKKHAARKSRRDTQVRSRPFV